MIGLRNKSAWTHRQVLTGWIQPCLRRWEARLLRVWCPALDPSLEPVLADGPPTPWPVDPAGLALPWNEEAWAERHVLRNLGGGGGLHQAPPGEDLGAPFEGLSHRRVVRADGVAHQRGCLYLRRGGRRLRMAVEAVAAAVEACAKFVSAKRPVKAMYSSPPGWSW